MNYFCTYCDQGYAARLMCLHDSLRAQGQSFHLSVLCLDEAMERVIQAERSPSLRAISRTEFLRSEADYAAIREQRTPVEFIFTATPVLIQFCLQREPEATCMTYLDSDLYFFGPASGVFDFQGSASVGIVPHRFPRRLEERLIYGTYNVSWVSFRRDADGLACLAWWRDRCLEWCHDHVDQGRFADQGYLDEFPRRFGGVRVLEHPGINAAPWNMEQVQVAAAGSQVRVNEQPLLFYHFQGIRELAPGWFEPGFRAYAARIAPAVRDLIYLPYLRRLVAQQQRLRAEHGILSRLQHDRLNRSASWRDRWQRLKRRWVQPTYRRLRGELLHCSDA